LLLCSPDERFELGKYVRARPPYEVSYAVTNTRVPVRNAMICGGDPFLTACLAKDVVLIGSDGDNPVLRWTRPDMPECDPETLLGGRQIPGRTVEASFVPALLVQRDG